MKRPNILRESKRMRRRYNVPVIGHFSNGSYIFPSILEAEADTGINYNLIFENCIGKIKSAKFTKWTYQDPSDLERYKKIYKIQKEKYTKLQSFG